MQQIIKMLGWCVVIYWLTSHIVGFHHFLDHNTQSLSQFNGSYKAINHAYHSVEEFDKHLWMWVIL